MISRTWILLAALVWGGPAGAHAQSWSASRVDSHAPLGVMEDHTHEAGEWMLSFRAMRMVMDGNRTDTARVPAAGVLVDYPVTPLQMPMDMYMVGAMYAPTDRLTLVGMVPVLGISMDHRTRTGVEFTTESGGIGDVQMSALVGVAAGARQRAHLHLGVSAPTGSINERGETPATTNVRLPYPMQVGAGAFDAERFNPPVGLGPRDQRLVAARVSDERLIAETDPPAVDCHGDVDMLMRINADDHRPRFGRRGHAVGHGVASSGCGPSWPGWADRTVTGRGCSRPLLGHGPSGQLAAIRFAGGR